MRVFTHARQRAIYFVFVAMVSVLVAAGAAQAGTFTNATPILISGIEGYSQPTLSIPYPSDIAVSGVTGTVTNVTIKLNDLVKPSGPLREVDFLLVSPIGDKLLLLSDAGEGITGAVTLTFDDAAASALPLFGSVVSGTYKPTNYGATDGGISPCGGGQVYTEPDPDDFSLNPPAPAPPYGSALSIFNGDDANGTWKLYALSDCLGGASATVASGWSIAITTTTQTAARMTSFSAAPAKQGVTVRWRTASEVDVLGFNVYRRTVSGPLRRVNRSLIAAKGDTSGATYRFVDRSARAGHVYAYRLQLVDTDGTRSWYGSARVRAGRT
jgi:hypothetical protein